VQKWVWCIEAGGEIVGLDLLIGGIGTEDLLIGADTRTSQYTWPAFPKCPSVKVSTLYDSCSSSTGPPFPSPVAYYVSLTDHDGAIYQQN
jgi:hypothetical protein